MLVECSAHKNGGMCDGLRAGCTGDTRAANEGVDALHGYQVDGDYLWYQDWRSEADGQNVRDGGDDMQKNGALEDAAQPKVNHSDWTQWTVVMPDSWRRLYHEIRHSQLRRTRNYNRSRNCSRSHTQSDHHTWRSSQADTQDQH